MPEFQFQEMFPHGEDTTSYRKLSSDHVGVTKFNGRDVLTVEPEALTLLTAQAFHDISHLLRPGHLAQLRSILDDGEASANDKYVALELLKNANIAAGGVLPMCQDTGTAIVMGKKGQAVWTGGGDEAAIAKGVFKTYTETNLRYSQVSPISMFKEVQTGTNLPAQIDIYATDGDAYKFLFVAKGGGSANKSYLYQQTPAVLNEAALLKFLDTQIRTLGTAACPPYHLAIVVGGTSAEMNLKTVKLASTRYLDDLPSEGNDKGVAIRDREMEKKVLELTRQMGIGAQFGGKYFCHDVRVIRIARHGASVPIGMGVSCSADRQAVGKITKDGIFLEQLETNPAHYLPEVEPQQLSGDVVAVDLNKGMAHTLSVLTQAPREDAGEPHRHADRGARFGACEAQGAARPRRRPARLLQAVPGLLRRPGQDAGGHAVGLVRPDHGRPHGFLCRSVPGQWRLDGDAGQGQPQQAGRRRLQEAQGLLSRLDRRPRRHPGQELHPQGRGAGISRARHGSDLAHPGRELPGLHRHRRQGQRLLQRAEDLDSRRTASLQPALAAQKITRQVALPGFQCAVPQRAVKSPDDDPLPFQTV